MQVKRENMAVLTNEPEAPVAVMELVICGCKVSECDSRFNCRNVVCIEACECEANDENCTHSVADYLGELSDEEN